MLTNLHRKRSFPAVPQVWELALFAGLLTAAYLSFNHPDILETARHAYILLRSTFDGQFFSFYENTLSRVYGYDYSNAAHYNIAVYILYAVWEVPIYLLEKLTGAAFSDVVLALWCKAIGVGFYLGCGLLMGRLAKEYGCSEEAVAWAPLAFWLNPIAFLTVAIMGQYDSLCLFFVLWALLAYKKRHLWKFSLIMGAGLVCKFFPLFLLLPLLLMAEKRVLRIMAYLATALWLYLPTTLLFRGHTGDAAFFNGLMTDRLFAQNFPGGAMDASYIGIGMALICVAAWLYAPPTEDRRNETTIYMGLAVFGILFLFVLWHPQWLLLLVPFLVLTTLRQHSGAPLAVVDGVLAAGFVLMIFLLLPNALEGDMLDMGALNLILGMPYSLAAEQRAVSFYLGIIPHLKQLIPVCFYSALLAELGFKAPWKNMTVAEKLSAANNQKNQSIRTYVWMMFIIVIGCVWLAPVMFAYMKTVFA